MCVQYVERKQNIWYILQGNINFYIKIKRSIILILLLVVLGGFTKMYKKFFLWLQLLAAKNNDINLSLIDRLKAKVSYNIYWLYNDCNLMLESLRKINISNDIISCFLDENIKVQVESIYSYVIFNNLYLITIEDKEFPRDLIDKENNVFCYISNKKVNMNNKNIYLYFNEYYTKFARNLIKYFAKIIIEERANLITEFDYLEKTEVTDFNNLKFNVINSNNYIILLDNKYIDRFKMKIIDSIIIIEARYEKQIVNIVDKFIEENKDIFVVPSNIFRKNSYFSNYLIKQGADIILNKNDLKFILNRIIC